MGTDGVFSGVKGGVANPTNQHHVLFSKAHNWLRDFSVEKNNFLPT